MQFRTIPNRITLKPNCLLVLNNFSREGSSDHYMSQLSQNIKFWPVEPAHLFNISTKKLHHFVQEFGKLTKMKELSNWDLKLVEKLNKDFQTPIGQVDFPQILSLIFTCIGLIFTASVAIKMCCTKKHQQHETDKEMVYLNPSAPSYPILRENRKD